MNDAAPAPPRSIVAVTAAISILTALIAFVLFVAASRAVLPGDAALHRERVAEAFATGKLVEDYVQLGSTSIGSHQWNDCLIVAMAIDQRGDPTRLALSPILTDLGHAPSMDSNPCAVLAAVSRGAVPSATLYHYDRYPHGAVVLLRALLPHAGIARIRTIYRATLTLLLLASLALAMIGLVRGRNPPAFALIAVTGLALMRYFGLESFSQSLGHGPADAVLAGYLLALAAIAFRPAGLTLALIAAALFGVLTMIFELFTGGVPIGLAMVVGLTPLVVRPGIRPLVAAAAAASAFLGAGALFYLVKMAVTAGIGAGGLVGDASAELLRLTIFSPRGELADSTGFAVAVRETINSIDALTGGMWLLSAGTLAIAALAGGYGLWWLRRGDAPPALRDQALLLALSAAIPLLWCLLFLNLMVNHAWFTDRVLVWPIAVGFGLFVLALMHDHASPARRLPAAAPATTPP